MSLNETLYLLMCLAVFAIFGGTLAYYSRQQDKPALKRLPVPVAAEPTHAVTT